MTLHADPRVLAALIDLAQSEFREQRYQPAAAVLRLVRERAPDEPEPQRLLGLIRACLSVDGSPAGQGADLHRALGDAHVVLGEHETAARHYRAALSLNPDAREAHLGLASLRMPGDPYLVWLERLYAWLAPDTAIEIGVDLGASLALLRPPAIAIGIDPIPTVTVPLKTETHIFVETSDEFFAHRRAETLLAGRPLSVAFIDGLHLYEQALRDFINLESWCGPRSVILFHDTVPLDEPTQTRIRHTRFHTGDVWKTVLCLKHYRPDLDIFTIATPPTGLTVVTGVDPTSRVLRETYHAAVARFIETPFSAVEHTLDTTLNVIPNDWSMVESRLKQREII